VFEQEKVLRKLLNVRSGRAIKFAEITALVPFSTATGVCTNHRIVSEMAGIQQLMGAAYRPQRQGRDCTELLPDV
jgi:hypothetical protein